MFNDKRYYDNYNDKYIVNEHMKRVGKYKRTVRESSEQVSIPCQMINCFCMFSDYVPLTLDEWIELDRKRRIKISISDEVERDEAADNRQKGFGNVTR